jgi:hypothetical protein
MRDPKGRPWRYYCNGFSGCDKCLPRIGTQAQRAKHGRLSYEMAVPHVDMADAIQDAQQDGIIR